MRCEWPYGSKLTQNLSPQSSLCEAYVPDDAAHVVADAGLPLRGKGRGVGKLPAGVRVVGHGKPVILFDLST